MKGAGKYDREGVFVQTVTKAELVFLAVCGGEKGDGITVLCKGWSTLEALELQARLLRGVLEDVELHIAELKARAQ